MPRVSALVCTYNRCESFRDTLQALEGQRLDKCLDFEILVVDNNSNDKTRPMVEEVRQTSTWPVRYLFEPIQGKTHALNRGINAATGDFIAFCDDDTVPELDWVQRLYEALDFYKADCTGGPVRPLWQGKPPKWLDDPARHFGPLAVLDRGDKPIIAGERERVRGNFLLGSNMAVRRSVFREVGLFRTDLGRAGANLGGSEDSEMMRRLLIAGKRLVYVPTAVVWHKIPFERMTLAYLRKWNFWMARTTARMSELRRVTLRFLLLDCAKSVFVALAYYVLGRQEKAVGAEINFWWRLGMFVELFNRKLSGRSYKTEPCQPLA